MPFLTTQHGRATLRLGSNVLGGTGPDAVALPALQSVSPAAVLIVRPDALSVIRRIDPRALIRVDGHALGEQADLRHGTRIDIGNQQLTYGHPAPLRSGPGFDPSTIGTEVLPSVDASASATELLPSVGPSKSEYRLINVKTDEAIDVPASGAVLGRDRGCDVIVGGQGVSRRHAIIQPGGGGYLLTDQSSNGTRVNGSPIAAAHSLRSGDVITIGTTDYRWEAKVPAAAPPRPMPQSAAKRAEPFGALPVLATLSNRSLWRKEFRIERPVVSIGRGEQNDVRVVHESVSASHATLVRKGETWFVLDLGSSNGTFVDGLRVAGERELPAGATLTLGKVKLTFHPSVPNGETGIRTQHVGRGELFRRLAQLWEKGSSRRRS